MTNEPDTPAPPQPDAEAQPQPDTSARMSEAERARERVAFQELIDFVAAHKDADSEITHVSPDEFDQTLED